MDTLERVGISMKEVTDKVLVEGVQLFADAFDKLLKAVDRKGQNLEEAKTNRQSYKLPPDLDAAVRASLEDWKKNDKVRRLWARDASLWTNTDESNWLGWLNISEEQLARIQHFKDVAKEIRAAGFTHALLLGMGGSSLCPEVLSMTFGKLPGFPELHVLDSTDPAQIKARANAVDLAKTVFIVSSKSGTTLEPNIYKQYFFERVKHTLGEKEAGKRFIAITDPGSQLQKVAEREGFRHIFFGVPSIGGRYSALSHFCMDFRARIGVDVAKLLGLAEGEVVASAPT